MTLKKITDSERDRIRELAYSELRRLDEAESGDESQQADTAPTTPAPQSVSEPPQAVTKPSTSPPTPPSLPTPQSLPTPPTTSSVVDQIKSADSDEEGVRIALDFARRNPTKARTMAIENPMLAMRLYNAASDLGLSLGDLGISSEGVAAAADSGAVQQALIKPTVQQQQSQQAKNPWSQQAPGQQAQQPTGPQGSGFEPIWGKTDPWDDFAYAVASGMVARDRRHPGRGAGAAFLAMTRRGYLRRLGMDNYLTGANAKALFRDAANRAGGMLPRNPPVSGVGGATLPTGGGGGQVQQGQQQPSGGQLGPQGPAPAATTMAPPPSGGMPTEVESYERIMQSMGMDPAGAPELMRMMGVTPPQEQEEDPARTLEDWAMENPTAAMKVMEMMPSGGESGGMGGGLSDIPTKAFGGDPWTPAAAGVGGAVGGVGAAEALGGGVGDVAGGAVDALGGLAGGAADALGGLTGLGADIAGGLADLVTSGAAGTAGPLDVLLGVPMAVIEGIIGGIGGLFGGVGGGAASAAVAAPAALAGTVASTVGSGVPVLGGIFSGLGAVLQGIASVALAPFGI